MGYLEHTHTDDGFWCVWRFSLVIWLWGECAMEASALVLCLAWALSVVWPAPHQRTINLHCQHGNTDATALRRYTHAHPQKQNNCMFSLAHMPYILTLNMGCSPKSAGATLCKNNRHLGGCDQA